MDGFIFRAEVSDALDTVASASALLTVNTIPEIVNQPQDTTICSTENAAFGVVATGTALTYEWQVKIGQLHLHRL